MPTPPPLAAHWVHDLSPFLIEFPDGWPLGGIRWYGIAYLAGFGVAWWMLARYERKGLTPINADQRSALFTALIIGVLLGGRLGYMLLYGLGDLFSNPLTFFKVWEGGMASHGGIIGVALALVWFARTSGVNLLHVGDCIASVAPAGLFFGRIANFINGELWGTPSTVSWAVIFPDSPAIANHATGRFEIVARHPSQLYQAALEGLFLFAWCQWRIHRGALRTRGAIVSEFLILYGVVRIGAEVFREPDAGISLILGMSRGQFYSIFLILIGIALKIAIARKSRPCALNNGS